MTDHHAYQRCLDLHWHLLRDQRDHTVESSPGPDRGRSNCSARQSSLYPRQVISSLRSLTEISPFLTCSTRISTLPSLGWQER